MGWDVARAGFRLVLAPDVPEVVESYLGDDVRDSLRRMTSRSATSVHG